jgi:hypothetical protein
MIDDDILRQMLRTALPVGAATPPRDLWPAVVQRSQARAGFSSTDASMAAIVVIVLLMFPRWFWFLAYHL